MDEIKPLKIKVDGKPVSVFKAGFVHGLQRSLRITEAGKDVPAFYHDLHLSEDVVRYVHTLLYPSLISCSEGKLPTEERFVHLYDEDVNAWLEAASTLNPDWFSSGDSKPAKEAAEKKG